MALTALERNWYGEGEMAEIEPHVPFEGLMDRVLRWPSDRKEKS